MSVNVTKAKKQSNVRSSGNDEKRNYSSNYLIRRSFRIHSKDEYVEVTPKSIRLRKYI
jgi:GTP-binding protein